MKAAKPFEQLSLGRVSRTTSLPVLRKFVAWRLLFDLLIRIPSLAAMAQSGQLTFAFNPVVRNPSNGRQRHYTCVVFRNSLFHPRPEKELGRTFANLAIVGRWPLSASDRIHLRQLAGFQNAKHGVPWLILEIKTCFNSPTKALSRLSAELGSDYLDRACFPHDLIQFGLVLVDPNCPTAARQHVIQIVQSLSLDFESGHGRFDHLAPVLVDPSALNFASSVEAAIGVAEYSRFLETATRLIQSH